MGIKLGGARALRAGKGCLQSFWYVHSSHRGKLSSAHWSIGWTLEISAVPSGVISSFLQSVPLLPVSPSSSSVIDPWNESYSAGQTVQVYTWMVGIKYNNYNKAKSIITTISTSIKIIARIIPILQQPTQQWPQPLLQAAQHYTYHTTQTTATINSTTQTTSTITLSAVDRATLGSTKDIWNLLSCHLLVCHLEREVNVSVGACFTSCGKAKQTL